MAAATVASPSAVEGIDDLFNYDAGIDDFFKNLDKNDDRNSPDHQATAQTSEQLAKLGIDEVVKVRKRQPIAKLDEARLLSARGIPRLKKVSKDKLRFKGKGHEFSDVTRLLNMYQLWLDDLYPRAKFADALVMVEKVGHTKTMQMQRKEWIYESKKAESNEEVEEGTRIVNDSSHNDQQQRPEKLSSDGDEALFVTQGPGEIETTATKPGYYFNEPEQDELDALLAEEPSQTRSVGDTNAPTPGNHDNFADEMEAMADLDDMW